METGMEITGIVETMATEAAIEVEAENVVTVEIAQEIDIDEAIKHIRGTFNITERVYLINN
jgi:hypothetical protein